MTILGLNHQLVQCRQERVVERVLQHLLYITLIVGHLNVGDVALCIAWKPGDLS